MSSPELIATPQLRHVTQAEIRIRAIADIVVEERSVNAQALAAQFGVSLMTIHRDLDKLETLGIVRKQHGGARAQPWGVIQTRFAYRKQARLEEKAEIAAYAATFVEPGMSIMLDSSTTTQHMLPHLEQISPLRVATNFLDSINELSGMQDIDLVAIGGDYDGQRHSFLGVGCIDAIHALRVDAAFMSATAVSDGLAFHEDERTVSAKRAMLDVSARKYLLLDHSKIGKTALHSLASLADFDLVIVNAQTADETLESFARAGIPYGVAPRLTAPLSGWAS
jgi:DeoR/GlpR family transcriptional regulator of sugar metabolism